MKGFVILHNQLLQKQIANEQEKQSIYASLPVDIRGTLDDMAYGISVKENLDSFIIKQRMVSKINMLHENDAYYLVSQMAILIELSLHKEEEISDKNVDKDFVNFLLRLFY